MGMPAEPTLGRVAAGLGLTAGLQSQKSQTTAPGQGCSGEGGAQLAPGSCARHPADKASVAPLPWLSHEAEGRGGACQGIRLLLTSHLSVGALSSK